MGCFTIVQYCPRGRRDERRALAALAFRADASRTPRSA